MESTQRVASELAARGAEPGSWVVADRQTAGRGRLDRSWTSPAGGLYLTVLAAEPPTPTSLVPLAAGLAVREALAEFGADLRLKWPNDLLWLPTSGAPLKLAGILVDRVASPRFGHLLAVGIGVNVGAPLAAFPTVLQRRVAGLSEIAGRSVPVFEVESAIVPRVVSRIKALRTQRGRTEAIATCRASLYGRGHRALVDGEPAGVVDDVADDGSLWLTSETGRRNFLAGDLVIEEA